jgi:D-glycero-alpha-D-manno-heptose-7-phosphate kinase
MDIPGTIRARVPLRLDLAGSGTDLSPYCVEFGGAVLNTTIDRYAYAFIEPAADGLVHFVAPDLGIFEHHVPDLATLDGSRLPLHAGVLRRMATMYGNGVPAPMRITSYVDAASGSGLGSSSALVVALVSAFAALHSAPLGPYDVAHLAFEIERVDLLIAGGKQDQYAGTFGGTNYIEFHADDRVIVNPLRIPPAVLNELETSLVVCPTGISSRSEAIIVEQQQRMAEAAADALHGLHQLKRDAIEMKDALLRGQIDRMADIFNRSWLAKKQTASGVSTGKTDMLYEVAIASGAIGGKMSGAGGGGTMIFVVPPARRMQVVRTLERAGARAAGVHFTNQGAESWIA